MYSFKHFFSHWNGMLGGRGVKNNYLYLDTTASRTSLIFSAYSAFICPKFISVHFLSPAVYWDCSSYHPHWPTNHQNLSWFSILQLVFNWNTLPTFKNLFSLKDFVALFSNFFIAFLFVFYWLFLPIT